MIKLENVVLASPEQMKFIIEGMRNPMNSWEKSDSSDPGRCAGTRKVSQTTILLELMMLISCCGYLKQVPIIESL